MASALSVGTYGWCPAATAESVGTYGWVTDAVVTPTTPGRDRAGGGVGGPRNVGRLARVQRPDQRREDEELILLLLALDGLA